jgi:glycine/D-amino acid oxidase-like deaminating enzyme/nitrite reductase/ring-hydroxylating ferredoxin subunit
MNVDHERSRSLWMDAAPEQRPALAEDIRTKVLVIGAGISGLSTAYELTRAGVEVVVLDRGSIGTGMTARTSAHLAFESDDFYHELISVRGEDAARQYFESQKAAVDRIEEIAKREAIACDFARLALFFFAPDKDGRKHLEKEYEAVQRIGLPNVAWADAPVAGKTEGALRFPDQGRFHPLKYLSGLARAIEAAGGRIHGDTVVSEVEEGDRRVTCKTVSGRTIIAESVVVATNSPFVDRITIHTKQAPYRTYIVTMSIAKSKGPDALIWDTLDPYHYVRRYEGAREDLLIIGGEDHKTGTADDAKQRLRRLESWARKRFPDVKELRHQWSGQVFEPVDNVQFIGLYPGHKRIYLVTGDSGSGLTMGVTASLLLSDLIAKRKNPWTQVYDPARKPMTALGTFTKENLGAAKHIVKHLAIKTAAEPTRRGTGAVIGTRKKIAAYRDDTGRLHRLSASCTHVGCVVEWNSFERCWDCPCHGSHFAGSGEALQAPAVSPLSQADPEPAAPKKRAARAR